MKLHLVLKRFYSSQWDTVSSLFFVTKFSCFILEDEERIKKVSKETRIPAGLYELGLRYSPKHTPSYGHEMIYLKGVVGFEEGTVQVHIGNKEEDTDGCLLTGNGALIKPDEKALLIESRKAYERVYPLIAQAIKTDGADMLVIDEEGNPPVDLN